MEEGIPLNRIKSFRHIWKHIDKETYEHILRILIDLSMLGAINLTSAMYVDLC